RDTILKALARLALLGDDANYCQPLGHVSSLGPDGTGMFAQALQYSLDSEAHPSAQFAGLAACEAIGDLQELPNSIADLLEQVVLGVVPPELRIAAARAIAAHPDVLSERFNRLNDALAELLEIDVVPTRAGAVGALLELGNGANVTASLAVMLVADGVPPFILAGPLERGLRQSPGIVQGIVDMLSHSAPELFDAVGMLLMTLTDSLSDETSAGPFTSQQPLNQTVRQTLLNELLPYVGDLSHPQRAGQVAIICG